MKKILILTFSFLIISCNKNQNCNDNQKIRTLETNNIIKSLGLDTIKNSSMILCTSLKKMFVRTDLRSFSQQKDSVVTIKLPKTKLITQNTEIFIEKLLETKLEGKSIFTKRDSLNFIEQNDCLSDFIVSGMKSDKTISLKKLEQEKSNYDFIIISIPIFSKDNKKAYIEIDKYSKDHKHGQSYFLEKFRKTWKIIHITRNWSAC